VTTILLDQNLDALVRSLIHPATSKSNFQKLVNVLLKISSRVDGGLKFSTQQTETVSNWINSGAEEVEPTHLAIIKKMFKIA
jgi:hypothetical protein